MLQIAIIQLLNCKCLSLVFQSKKKKKFSYIYMSEISYSINQALIYQFLIVLFTRCPRMGVLVFKVKKIKVGSYDPIFGASYI